MNGWAKNRKCFLLITERAAIGELISHAPLSVSGTSHPSCYEDKNLGMPLGLLFPTHPLHPTSAVISTHYILACKCILFSRTLLSLPFFRPSPILSWIPISPPNDSPGLQSVLTPSNPPSTLGAEGSLISTDLIRSLLPLLPPPPPLKDDPWHTTDFKIKPKH